MFYPAKQCVVKENTIIPKYKSKYTHEKISILLTRIYIVVYTNDRKGVDYYDDCESI